MNRTSCIIIHDYSTLFIQDYKESKIQVDSIYRIYEEIQLLELINFWQL